MLKTLSFLSVSLFVTIGMLLNANNVVASEDFTLGFTAQPGPDSGTVSLSWTNVADLVENYNLAYGTSPGSHEYGAVNIGKHHPFVVRGLNPGTKYYFTLSPIVRGEGLSYLPEVSAIASVQGGQSELPVSQSVVHATDGGPGPAPYYLRAKPGANSGEVVLEWQNHGGADTFDLVYGSNGINDHGFQNIPGSSNSYTVGHLDSGKKYFFSLLPEKEGKPHGDFLHPISTTAR